MRAIYPCFPGGRCKALTLSYDDGRPADRRLVELLNQYGLKATFHLNSGLMEREDYVPPQEAAALYRGHEVACHSVTHPMLDRMPPHQAAEEILEDRRALEHIAGAPVRGFSYPFGAYNEALLRLLPALGVAYARTVEDSGWFDMPRDFYRWAPTCHHNNALMQRTEEFLTRDAPHYLSLFYVWGHSYEFDRDHNWDHMEAFARRAGGRGEVWYATNLEIHDYMEAARRMRYTADCTYAENPSALPVWLQLGAEILCVGPGATAKLG
jgi:peptidoglycan/xylan/chitin deacetylase (PgdA/CDA1 family)